MKTWLATFHIAKHDVGRVPLHLAKRRSSGHLESVRAGTKYAAPLK